MSKASPFFSVLMPTYNREHLLPFAIKSVLQQTFSDLELVISNGGSTDNTAAVVRSFDDPRICYIEAPERLSIGDNYQQAYDNARGEFITFLSDDDAFSFNTLTEAAAAIRQYEIDVLVFKSSFYFDNASVYNDSPVEENSLVIPHYTGEITRFERSQAATELFASFDLGKEKNEQFNVSYLANAVYRSSLLSTIRVRRPKLFDTTPADGYLAAAVAFVADSYHCLDKPLHVWTDWADNATASAEKKKNDIKKHYESLLQGKTLAHVPLKFTLPLNCFYNAIVMAKDDFDKDGIVSIDWSDYYFRTHQNLMFLKRIGVDVDAEMAEWHAALSAEQDITRQRVFDRTTRLSYRLKNFIGNNLPRFNKFVRTLTSRARGNDFQYFRGNENGFNNVFQCSQFVTELLSRL